MCRFLVYLGEKIKIGDVVVDPENSLVKQSRDASYHPGCNNSKRNIIVNGDGFGIAWYDDENFEEGACCFKFTTPAWSDCNLKR